jgi:hypothetical protein
MIGRFVGDKLSWLCNRGTPHHRIMATEYIALPKEGAVLTFNVSF